MDSNILSQIRIVDTDQILTYEWPQPVEQARDVDLSQLTVIRHPFIAVPADDDNYLLLGETGHFRALAEAGLRHLPIQVCTRDSLKIRGDRLGLDCFAYDDLVRLATRYPEQIILREDAAGRKPPLGFLCSEFKFSEGPRRVQAYLRHSSRIGCPQPFEQLFHAIGKQGRYLSIVDHIDAEDSLTRLATFTATLTIPEFDLDDLKSAATSERPFPPGIIRVSNNRRLLDIDFPISVLTSDISCSEKESFFRDLMVLRQQSRRTTVFEGQVYLMNQQMFS